MKSSRLRRLPKLSRLPWLASGVCAVGWPLLGLVGCADHSIAVMPTGSPAVVARGAPESTDKPAATETPGTLPISLDMVLRLACEQNPQIALAREKLSEACHQQSVADLAWLPNVYVGVAYWRHEGGIQNEDGTLTHSSFGGLYPNTEINVQLDAKEAAFQKVNASRQVWQRKGELSKTTSDTLLDAATTYIDLLLARTSEAIALQLEKHETELLKSARDLVTKEPATDLQVEALEAESQGHRQAIAKVRQQGDAAAYKLAQLLGLDPNVKLMPIDDRLAPFALADANAPVDELVGRALANGPGVRELEGLLGVVQSSIEKSKGPGVLLPIIELHATEGGFGAGPGDDMRWDNRFDFGVCARWNLTDFCKAGDQRRIAESRLQQVVLTHQDLRQKLTIGVHEARSAVLGGEQQIRHGADQIRHANKVYQLSNERRTKFAEEKYKVTELQALQALRTLELAHLRYLEAVSSYDKAQLRLLVLTGATTCESPLPKTQPASLPAPTTTQSPER